MYDLCGRVYSNQFDNDSQIQYQITMSKSGINIL